MDNLQNETDNETIYGSQRITNTNRDDNFSRWRLDSGTVIQKILTSLRGLEWNDENKKYEQVNPPILNNKGVREIELILETYLNPISLTTDLTDESITHLTRRMGEEIAILLATQPEEMGVDRKIRSLLHKKLTDQVYFSLRKSKDAGERKSVTETYQLIEREGNQNKQKNKIWG